jgi:hypothetical protein
MRANDKPHWRTMVWIGSYDCERYNCVLYEPSAAAIHGDDGAVVPAHLAAFALGYLAFQVFSVDFVQAELHHAGLWNDKVPAHLARRLPRIWPQQLTSPPVTWPPEQFPADEWRRMVTWDGKLRPTATD